MQLDAIDLRSARNKTLVRRICVACHRKCSPEKKYAAYGQTWKQSNHTVHGNLLELVTQYTRMAAVASETKLLEVSQFADYAASRDSDWTFRPAAYCWESWHLATRHIAYSRVSNGGG